MEVGARSGGCGAVDAEEGEYFKRFTVVCADVR